MNRDEFLNGLRVALEPEVDSVTLNDNMTYYRQYISDEVRKGRSEEEVVAELGDPWVIARTIIDAAASSTGNASYRREDNYGSDGRPERVNRTYHVAVLDTWWKKFLAIAAVVAVVAIVFAIIGGIVSLVAPILIPVIVILIVFRVLKRTDR